MERRLLNIDLAKTSSRVPRGGWQAPCGMSMRYARRESDRRLSQPGVAKPRVAATLEDWEKLQLNEPAKKKADIRTAELPVVG